MPLKLRGPVGDLKKSKKRGNFPDDVKAVETALRTLGLAPSLSIDGTADADLIAEISKFQRLFQKASDGRIDSPGATLQRLSRLTAGKAIIVSLKRQKLTAFDTMNVVHQFDCVSGDADNLTPPGYYEVQVNRKHKEYRSKKYNAQMDYAMFFHQGYAIHMAHVVGLMSYLKTSGIDYFGSHGCVRLSEEDAQRLFEWTPFRTPVVILPPS